MKNLKQELKDSGRYEYTEREFCFRSHKHQSNLIFMDDVAMIQYVAYTTANPVGAVIFEIITDISLDQLERIIEIFEETNTGDRSDEDN